MSTLEASLRDLIARYVAVSISLDDLSRGLPDGWDMDQADDRKLRRLVLMTVGRIADVERDALTEEALRALLSPEASWHLETSLQAINPPLPPAQSLTEVRAGAGTRSVAVLAS